jgi:thiol-disulfide isomerase/thioredoxin
MFRTNAVSWLCVVVAGATLATARAEEGLFRELSLDQAKRAAADGRKQLVLVDFYTTWCGPCKKLDETTWKDPGVIDWLGKNAICLKVDAEKEAALAATYRINAYPTVLLLRPDGAEIDRLVGYRDAKAFLADAGEALTGNDSLARARKKLEGTSANDPMLRSSYGDALAQKGRAEDALSEYLWCFDHGVEHRPSFIGVRNSFLLGKIVQLGRAHPAALDELRKRRDAARKLLEGGTGDFKTAMEFTAINKNLGEPDQTVALFDRIKGEKSLQPMVRKIILDEALDQLLTGKRYKEIIANSDAKALVRQRIADHERNRSLFPEDSGLRAYMKRQVRLYGLKYYEAFLGAGDPAGAAEIAALLVGFDPANAYPELITAAKRAGDERAADLLTEQSRKAAKPAQPADVE